MKHLPLVILILLAAVGACTLLVIALDVLLAGGTQ